ncbi:hypothetical protein QZH41_009387 [Actinostola sp. cb2023]|nr:hypothetical protein QZH41_009387 [Actinostola sp. cb2023]
MELQPEEDSFAEPSFHASTPTSRPKPCIWRCNVVLTIKIILVVLLIVGAFIGGYLVRGAVHNANVQQKCQQPTPPPREHAILNETILDEMLAAMSAHNMEETLRYLTSQPHIAASARNTELAHNISDTWKSYGFDSVKLVKYNVLLSFPSKNKTNGAFILDDKGNISFRTPEQSKTVVEDENSPDASPPFSAYSPTGSFTGDVVYANYGGRDDFSYLNSKKVNCTDKIVIVRYGRVFRGDKVTNAAKWGARAILIFNDPKDFAPVPDDQLYPHNWWLPRSGVQRGSVLLGTGDPLTPRYPAKDGVYRSKTAEIIFPQIPAHPISAEDAEQFLSKMQGETAPDGWQGGINVDYKLGPGFKYPYTNWSAKVETNNDHVAKDIYNVIAVIKGRESPDRLVLLGNHRDAWVFGGIDPSSGTSCMMELSRVLSSKVKKERMPFECHDTALVEASFLPAGEAKSMACWDRQNGSR